MTGLAAEHAAMATTTQIGMTFDPPDITNAIRANGALTSGDNVENYVAWTVANQHNDWVDVICETVDDGDYHELFHTGHLLHNDSVVEGKPLAPELAGRSFHIYRWTPGFLNIPGSGGGEATFIMPQGGFVALRVTVVG